MSELQLPTVSTMQTPPITPGQERHSAPSNENPSVEETLFDFSRIDYELDRARRIGQGLWSSVYLAEPILKSPKLIKVTPPSTPRRPPALPFCRLFAVKAPARPDSDAIFKHEARILTKLQQSTRAHQHVVPFHGLDPRNSTLIFEGVIGGSLEDLSSRLKVMTELSRHLEIRALFPKLASDLISGLCFIHDSNVVHADIKPANILLDVVDDATLEHPMLRARYIDFSASSTLEEGSTTNAGGTWDFMAPEQLRIQKDLNRPTRASDVWSVGITLLSIIVGGSPYASACGGNLFMLREAIKSGDPLGFAQMDPVVHKRVATCQDFIDCCRLALQKDRDRRCTAAAWELWVQQQNWGLG